MIFSAHLPPARGKTEQFLDLLATVPTSRPFVAHNQTGLEQILDQMMGGSSSLENTSGLQEYNRMR
jgi:hypothetical protein